MQPKTSLPSNRDDPARVFSHRILAGMLGMLSMLALISTTSCLSLPDVPLTTPEPLKVDPIKVEVRIDLYQHGNDQADALKNTAEGEEVVERQRNRMAEIQDLKNSRLVGENHRGLLDIRNISGGDYGTYVKKTVEEENWDRSYLMREEAKRRDMLLPGIQEEQWIRRAELSFEGEWIEVADPKKEGAFLWKQKG